MSRIGPYSRPHVLAKLDGRTREARFMRDLRAELVAHVGGKPSVTQQALIERAVSLSLHVALMERKRQEGSGILSKADSDCYLAWSNALERTMRRLGLTGAAEKPKTLAEYAAERARRSSVGASA